MFRERERRGRGRERERGIILTQNDKGQDDSPYLVALSPEALGQEWVRTQSLLRALSGKIMSHITIGISLF